MLIFRRSVLCIALIALGLGLGACGTMRGAGQDIQDAGKAIKRAAG